MNKIEQIKELKSLFDSGVVNEAQYNLLLSEIVGVKSMQEQSASKTEVGIVEQPKSLYNFITIGNQEWMTENLKVKTFRNGDKIMEATSWMDWDKAE